MKINLTNVIFWCVLNSISVNAIRNTVLHPEQLARRNAARALALSGVCLMRCGTPINRVGYVTVLAAMALHDSSG